LQPGWTITCIYANIGFVQEPRVELEEVNEVVLLATRALVGLAARSLAAGSDDVSLAQHRVLVLLEGRGAQTMGALAEQLDVSPSTATRVCDRLEEKKLVRRRTDDADRRAVRVDLTPRGRKLIDRVMKRRRALIAGVLREMTPKAQRHLASALVQFSLAAGELSDRAWHLGWPVADRDLDA
jgi:DNA-binding MarR family transcriptional regulator